jgi:hypothetical protein
MQRRDHLTQPPHATIPFAPKLATSMSWASWWVARVQAIDGITRTLTCLVVRL